MPHCNQTPLDKSPPALALFKFIILDLLTMSCGVWLICRREGRPLEQVNKSLVPKDGVSKNGALYWSHMPVLIFPLVATFYNNCCDLVGLFLCKG